KRQPYQRRRSDSVGTASSSRAKLTLFFAARPPSAGADPPSLPNLPADFWPRWTEEPTLRPPVVSPTANAAAWQPPGLQPTMAAPGPRTARAPTTASGRAARQLGATWCGQTKMPPQPSPTRPRLSSTGPHGGRDVDRSGAAGARRRPPGASASLERGWQVTRT